MSFRPLLHLVFSLLGVLNATALADQASENSLKAGFVYNFAKFTDWPADGHHQLIICTLSRNPLDGQLSLLRGRRIGERSLEVRTGISSGAWRDCHLLFVPQEDAERAQPILRSASSHPLLTVGDFADFSQLGGHIELRENERRLQFEINQGAAQRAGLKLSSQLLKLAIKVRP